MASGNFDNAKVNRLIKELKHELYGKRPWWQRIKEWLTQW